MFKSLLRTSPLYSGNVKIACSTSDYNKIDKDTFECNIRDAKLYPLSHQLFQKNIKCGLLGSSYEFDLKNFYSVYSDYFYNNCFEYPKDDMPIIDYAASQYQRNTDFEFGVKRISYQKTGYQYAFFAPIYLEKESDIPNAFIIELELSFGGEKMKTTKIIQINIANNKGSKYNYIYPYISKYVNRIDSQVCYVSQYDDSANYFGIDVVHGGFSKYTDNSLSQLFYQQNTINNFDASLSFGFKRSKMVMKQILPLCFMFNIEDVLNGSEKNRYKNCDVVVHGYYLDQQHNRQCAYYDFEFDYDYFYQNIKLMNENDGMLIKQGTGINIQDCSFPSLNERRLLRYQFSNKLTPMYTRWKLKYSEDDYPYVSNVNYSFSKNQNSSYKYREFPTNFLNITAVCNVIKTWQGADMFNMCFPLGDFGIKYYKQYLPNLSFDTKNNIADATYSKIIGLMKDISNDSIIDKAWKLYNDDITSPIVLNELVKNFYQDNFYSYSSKNASSFLNGNTYLQDLQYFMNNILVKVAGPRNKYDLENLRELIKEYFRLIDLSYKYPEEFEEFKKQHPLNIMFIGEEKRNIYDIIYSHYNGKYVSRDTSIEYVREIYKQFKPNYLFELIYQHCYKLAKAEVEAYENTENMSIIDKYSYVRNNYSCDWFSIVTDIENNPDWWVGAEWKNIEDDKCYYRGVLYDIRNVYNNLKINSFEKIDKFGVFLWPEFNPLNDEENSKIIYSDWSLVRSSELMNDKNCNYNSDMMVDGVINELSTYMFENENGIRSRVAQWQYNKQYKKISYFDNSQMRYDEDNDVWYYNYGDTNKIWDTYTNLFVSLDDTNLIYNDVNKYYDIHDFNYLLEHKYSTSYLTSYLYDNGIYTLSPEDVGIAEGILYSKITGFDNTIESFELLPINYSYMLANKDIYNEITIDPTCPYTNQIDIDCPYQYKEKLTDPNYAHSNKWLDNCYQALADNLYISTTYLTDIIQCYGSNKDGSYAYIWDGPMDLCKASHGVNFYRKGEFIRASEIEMLKDVEYSDTFIENYIYTNVDATNLEYFTTSGNLIPISENTPNNKINYIKNAVNVLKNYVSSYMGNDLYNADEYQYNPIVVNSSGTTYAKYVFTKRVPETSRFFGTEMTEFDLPYDIDCLWIDTYNLANVFAGRIKDDKIIIPQMPQHVREMLIWGYDQNGLENWRHEFYAKFLSKQHLYHYYIELAKDKNGDFMPDWTHVWQYNIYVRCRRLVNNESISYYNTPESDNKVLYRDRQASFKLTIQDQYIPLKEFMDGYYPDIKWSPNFLRFYHDTLTYNSELDVFYIKGNRVVNGEVQTDILTTEPLELVFKREFVRMNKAVWDIIQDLSNDSDENYRDLYIYRLQRSEEYEEKYKSIKTTKFVNLEGPDYLYYSVLTGEFKNTDQCLVPLFNDIFEQDRATTELYSNYTLQNITETKVYGTYWGTPTPLEEDELANHWGIKDYIYRYNRNNAGVVVELSKYDVNNLLITPEHDNEEYIVNRECESALSGKFVANYSTNYEIRPIVNSEENQISNISPWTKNFSESSLYLSEKIVDRHLTDIEMKKTKIRLSFSKGIVNISLSINGENKVYDYNSSIEVTDGDVIEWEATILPNYTNRFVYRYLLNEYEYHTGKNLLDVLLIQYKACTLGFYDDTVKINDKIYHKFNDLGYLTNNIVNDRFKNENVNMFTMKTPDGTKYGFYLMKLTYDNTINSFNINTMKPITNQQTGRVNYDYNNNIKFFKYMNNYNVVDVNDNDYYEDYAIKVVRELIPFMKINPLDMMNNIESVLKPRMYMIETIYSQTLAKNVINGPEELILEYDPTKIKQSLLRYLDSVTPLIVKSPGTISDQYNLKFKNVQTDLIEDGKYNSIGDSVIYKDLMYVNEYHPIQIYSTNNAYNQGNNDMNSNDYNPYFHVKSYNMNIENFVPLEYKHYNVSKVINLSTKLEYKHPNKVYYEMLQELETEEQTFNVFKQMVAGIIDNVNDEYKEDFTRYLYSKYGVEYDSEPAGLNYDKSKKVYTLVYRFNLL